MNTRAAMLTCDNKLTTTYYLRSMVYSPRTNLLSLMKIILRRILDMIGGKFPVILKTLTGTQGVGVIKIEII